MFRNRFFRVILFLVIGLSLGAAIAFFQVQNEMDAGVIEVSPDNRQNATILKQPTRSVRDTADLPPIGGPFTLVDQTGTVVTNEDYKGQYKLVFFGFTYCPAICPTELSKVAQILDQLGEEGEQITPLFITIDPERDTVEQMAQYVEQFHPRLVGLTGTQEQINAVAEAYKVYATKVENEMMEEYMMDHTSFLYFMGPDDSLLTMYPSTDTAAYIEKDIKSQLP